MLSRPTLQNVNFVLKASIQTKSYVTSTSYPFTIRSHFQVLPLHTKTPLPSFLSLQLSTTYQKSKKSQNTTFTNSTFLNLNTTKGNSPCLFRSLVSFTIMNGQYVYNEVISEDDEYNVLDTSIELPNVVYSKLKKYTKPTFSSFNFEALYRVCEKYQENCDSWKFIF